MGLLSRWAWVSVPDFRGLGHVEVLLQIKNSPFGAPFMNNKLKLSLFVAGMLSVSIAMAEPVSAPQSAQTTSNMQSGIERMNAIMDAIKSGNVSALPESTQRAVQSGIQSGAVSADTSRMDAKTVDSAIKQAEDWNRMAKEAYVAALPPRDREIGTQVLLGDGTLPGAQGRMYIFVSRSMPQSMLRAYAVDAFYLGAKLVVKGIRKGDTLKEYITESLETYNAVDDQLMAELEINPNMFDMFDVKVVPAVVWTNRIGLDDVGSGCQDVPEGAPVEKLSLMGPYDEYIQVDKPACAKLPESAYYKLSGALAMPYVLDRFQEAGLPKAAADSYRALLAERSGNVHDGSSTQTLGNAIAPVSPNAKLDRYPRHYLNYLKEELASSNVQRGPFGPHFSPDAEDDAEYRRELEEKVNHQLGL